MCVQRARVVDTIMWEEEEWCLNFFFLQYWAMRERWDLYFVICFMDPFFVDIKLEMYYYHKSSMDFYSIREQITRTLHLDPIFVLKVLYLWDDTMDTVNGWLTK